MRIRTRPSPLLLLLLPAIVASLTTPPSADGAVLLGEDAPAAANKAVKGSHFTSTSFKAAGPTMKPGVGTKDAPVDGLDGKPHAGPFVDTSHDTKDTGVESDDSKKPLPTSLSKLNKAVADIPEKNDGVMNDPNREAPKKGTTGTEGGVSERTKQEKANDYASGEKTEKKPDPPKEAPPLPHSEQEALTGEAAQADKEKVPAGKPKGAQGLEKPTDLPDKPHDVPAPNANKMVDPDSENAQMPPPLPLSGASGSDNLKTTMPYTEGQPRPGSGDAAAEGIIQPFHSFILSFSMIIVSEIGDKTFLVAALMAMRHPRMVVFSAAFSALFAMTVLSAVLGHAVPTLLPKHLTAWAAALLFLVFGAKMVREGLAMEKDAGVGEEMQEVEAELEEKEELARKAGRRRSSLSPYVLESGRGRRSGSRGAHSMPKKSASPPSDDSRSPSPSSRKKSAMDFLGGLNNLLSLLLSPAWVQTFVMTFLGEWGDRSQIATIAMAAGQDYWWVTGGAITGHAICTGLAVLGGRALAGKVSLRVVTLGGAAAFLVFGVIYLLEAIYD